MLRGVLSLKNGDKYDGEFVDGLYDGYGKYFWSDGRWYEGLWKQGKIDKGTIFFPDGKFAEVENGQVQ
jgi:hypothetical protein